MEVIQYTDQWLSKELILEKYDLYKTMLYRIAFSYIGNKYDCEDILQEAFIRLIYHAPNFPSDEDEKRWAIRITINLCKNHLKSFWQRNKATLDDYLEYATSPEDSHVFQQILDLPDKYKIVVHLHYVEGYKILEIANILKLRESAVKMRLKRGRELLRIEMEV